jgi:iron(III) transport system substrate-binding protein
MSNEDTHFGSFNLSRLTRRTVLQAATLGGLGTVLAACASSDPPSSTTSSKATTTAAALDAADGTPEMHALVQAATKEKGLNYYPSVAPQINAKLLAGFTERYGISVNVSRQVTATNTARITAEVESGKVVGDVALLTSTSFVAQAKEKGWLVNPFGQNLPAVESFPKDFLVSDLAFTQMIGAYSLAYNTDLVKEADIPKGWQDILNPKWKGLIAISDPRGNDSTLAFFYFMGQTYGESFLTDFAKQEPKPYPGIAESYGPLGSGDLALAVPNNSFNTKTLGATGAPVGDVSLQPTTGLEEYMFILKGSPNPNTAKLFLNYALSVDGQNAQCEGLCSTVLPNVPGVIPSPGYKSAVPLFKEALAHKDETLRAMGLA